MLLHVVLIRTALYCFVKSYVVLFCVGVTGDVLRCIKLYCDILFYLFCVLLTCFLWCYVVCFVYYMIFLILCVIFCVLIV